MKIRVSFELVCGNAKLHTHDIGMNTRRIFNHDMSKIVRTPFQNGGGAFVGFSGVMCSEIFCEMAARLMVERRERTDTGEVTRTPGRVDARLDARRGWGEYNCGGGLERENRGG